MKTKLTHFFKTHMSLTVIIIAAILLEMTSAVMYYSAKNVIQNMIEKFMQREMNAITLCIRNKLIKVEATIDNMAWVVKEELNNPDSMFNITSQIVDNNPSIFGTGINFIPNYYMQKGRWFEPYSVKRKDGNIESMQLGSENHDYTNAEFFIMPINKNEGHWCEPYLDSEGAKAIVTTYGVPVKDYSGKIVAVVDADISLEWLDGIMNESKVYKSTRRFLVTGKYNLLAGDDSSIFRKALQELKNDDDKKGYVMIKDDDGKDFHVLYSRVGGMTDWMLINVLDDNDVFSKLRHVRLMLLLLVVASLIPIIFIIYRSSRSLEILRKVNEEKERVTGELKVASQIQKSLLPKNQIKHDDVDIAGTLIPAREVGGDIFDYFIRDEKLFFCIGDVSGKGAPSAMLMAVVHALFRSASAHENNPANIMNNINEASCNGNDANMFVTLFIGVLDLPTGNLRYCNAGHDAPIIINKANQNTKLQTLKCEPNLPIGIFDDFNYILQEAKVMPESIIFLYTDGITEARKGPRMFYGIGRTEKCLEKCAKMDMRPVLILETVAKDIGKFVGDAEQSDDVTMLAIKYNPKIFETIMTEELIIKNDIREVVRFSTFMKDTTDKMEIEPAMGKKIRLAVEEAVVNVIEYAYPAESEGDIEIKIMSDGQTLKIMIQDSGVPFDPTAKESTDTTLAAEERQIGGLGILLVRELMDTINYERENGKNILTLIKKIK